jgi:hypothetical protein
LAKEPFTVTSTSRSEPRILPSCNSSNSKSGPWDIIQLSSGNFSTNIRRRGLALRYIGDDVTWDDRPGTFISNEKFKNILPQLNFKKGESLNSALFPKIWTS